MKVVFMEPKSLKTGLLLELGDNQKTTPQKAKSHPEFELLASSVTTVNLALYVLTLRIEERTYGKVQFPGQPCKNGGVLSKEALACSNQQALHVLSE